LLATDVLVIKPVSHHRRCRRWHSFIITLNKLFFYICYNSIRGFRVCIKMTYVTLHLTLLSENWFLTSPTSTYSVIEVENKKTNNMFLSRK